MDEVIPLGKPSLGWYAGFPTLSLLPKPQSREIAVSKMQNRSLRR